MFKTCNHKNVNASFLKTIITAQYRNQVVETYVDLGQNWSKYNPGQNVILKEQRKWTLT